MESSWLPNKHEAAQSRSEPSVSSLDESINALVLSDRNHKKTLPNQPKDITDEAEIQHRNHSVFVNVQNISDY